MGAAATPPRFFNSRVPELKGLGGGLAPPRVPAAVSINGPDQAKVKIKSLRESPKFTLLLLLPQGSNRTDCRAEPAVACGVEGNLMPKPMRKGGG